MGTAEEHGGNAGKGNSAVEPDLYQSGAGEADGSFRVNPIGSDEAVVSYRIVNDHLGEGGAKEKFRRNIEAIRVLKCVENEKRAATADEQETLAGYVGWGGLSDAFSEKPEWMKEAQELRNLLTKDEYEAARATTLDSFYTSPVIIREIYLKLEDMGFHGGSILEPSMGVGNFFGAMPEDMRAGSRLFGVEKDGVSGRIARLLYPEVQIRIAGFEETQFPRESFDVVVGNIPFGDFRLYDRRFAKENFLIHDYFIARSLEEVHPRGIVALITSAGTMDKADESARRYYAVRAELLGAVRLPNNAFKANAGTDVTADILFFQKKAGISRDGMIRDNSLSEVPEWIHTTELGNGIRINSYFAKNPEMMLGEMALVSGRFGMTQTLIPSENVELGELLQSALARVEGRIIGDVLDG
ncbi:MAG: N-6 DNA methylase, partial [Lachnospiraceae bacterium]|nr:N-6 DNA methylase [Lachnospiraceae bacterium]